MRKAPPSERDEAVHDARKSLKKVRAVLRLMFKEMGPVASAENALFRDLARKLSALRDAAVLLETLDSLEKELPESVDPRLLATARESLAEDRAQVTGGLPEAQLTTAVAFALERACERVRTWPLRATGFAALKPGLRRTFHRGRESLACVRENPSPELFHEWRKRVKDHWYHMRLLEGAWTEATRSYERSLKELETCLGDDHNLAMLRERAVAMGSAVESDVLLAAIDRRQKLLRDRALHIGGRLYAPKSREFVQNIEEQWNAWQAKQTAGSHGRRTKQRRMRNAKAPAA